MNAALDTTRLGSLQAGFLARPHQLFIGGRWQTAQSGETFAVLDPSTGREIAQCAAGGAADVDLAVKAARKAFHSGPWPSMSHAERGKLMMRLAEAVERNADELALLESLDGGNPVRSTRHIDINMAIDSLRYNAGWTTKLTGAQRAFRRARVRKVRPEAPSSFRRGICSPCPKASSRTEGGGGWGWRESGTPLTC